MIPQSPRPRFVASLEEFVMEDEVLLPDADALCNNLSVKRAQGTKEALCRWKNMP